MLQNLSTKHLVAAALRATGASWLEVAVSVGLEESYVRTLSNSPLFQAEVDRIREKFQAQVVAHATSKLQLEALRSVELLVQVRDDVLIAPVVRIKAADSILDRVPKTSKTQRHVDDTPRELALTDTQVHQLLNVLNDDPVAMSAFEEAQRRAEVLDLLSVDEGPSNVVN